MNDVKLPSTPSVILSRNMQSMESDLTTTFLNNWVDLIFGWKQQGKEAVASYNVFYYLTYPSNCDITGVEDESTRTAVLTQAAHFGQCPQLLFKDAHVTKRMSQFIPRHLRNTLLLSDPSSIYKESTSRWMGHHARIQGVSDFSPSMLSSIYKLQYILGGRTVQPHSTQDAVSCADCLVWPAESSYPWYLTIDNCDMMEMSLVKVILKVDSSLSYNIKNHCIRLEVFTEESTWKEVESVTEMSSRIEGDVVIVLTFPAVITRYWRMTILDIPYSPQFISPLLKSHPVYTCGDPSNDVENAPQIQTVSQQGPYVKMIDFIGKNVFPHVPPKGVKLSDVNTTICHMALW